MIQLIGILATLLTFSHSAFAFEAKDIDAVINLEVETHENGKDEVHTCKGVIVSESQFISVDHCIKEGQTIKAESEKTKQWLEVESVIRSNGLALVDIKVPFNTYLIRIPTVKALKNGRLDSATNVKMCASIAATEKLEMSDGGSPLLNSNGEVTGMMYSVSYDPAHPELKQIQYACISEHIESEINPRR